MDTDNGARVFTGERDFKAIRETRKIDFEVRMIRCQMLESFETSFNDRGLKTRDRITFEAGCVRQETGYATRRRCQPGIGVNAHAQVLGFSVHGS